jgi:hypothetical protein
VRPRLCVHVLLYVCSAGCLPLRVVWSCYECLVRVMLGPTVSRPLCLGVKYPSGAQDYIFITVRQLEVCWCEALSLTRGRVCRFTIAAGLCQRSHSRVRIPRDSWPYFTVSDSRLPQHGGPGPRIYISYSPRHWVPFPSAFTTPTATADVAEPSSQRAMSVDRVGGAGSLLYRVDGVCVLLSSV